MDSTCNKICDMINLEGRLIVVSNRLPITLSKKEDGTWESKMSSGGLVAALSGINISKDQFVWIGWVGCEIPDEEKEPFKKQMWEQHQCIPVFLDDKTADEHYNGFSNGVLWPLCHYMLDSVHHDAKLWNSYLKANKEFADVVIENYRESDIIWVHDYHLMMCPQYIKEKCPSSSIGFFLHIPFPSSEIFKILPVRRELLNSVVHCDLVGFHTWDYSRHFLQSCSYLLPNVETTPTGVYAHSRHTLVGAFPVGIEPEKFEEALKEEKVLKRIKELKKSFEGKKVILGVDRLDYIKGVPHKLRSFELFLSQREEWREKVVLVQIAVPTRTEVPEYQLLKSEAEELVGRINGNFGTISFNPIHYLFKSVDFHELCALYSISDAILITSIRDGMNLVCQEYIMCQQERNGVVILSEFAGAAQSLSSAVRVNPWNSQQVADAIHHSLTLPLEKRKMMQEASYKHIITHTSNSWGKRFIYMLSNQFKKNHELKNISHFDFKNVIEKYKQSHSRLFVLNYDGGLHEYSRENFKTLIRPSKRILETVQHLSEDMKSVVFIYSGRERQLLDEWFGHIPVGLIAEHGYFIRTPDSRSWFQYLPSANLTWQDHVLPILEYYSIRTPGSEIEIKEVHITWHYRRCPPDFGVIQARDLHNTLSSMHDIAVEIIHDTDQKTIEVRPPTSTIPILHKLKIIEPDFILHIGDLQTGERIREIFKGITDDENVFTLTVGRKQTQEQGQFKGYLPRTSSVFDLIDMIVESNKEKAQIS